MRFKRLLVTGGSGFIGSAFIRRYLNHCDRIVNLDLLTYAGDSARLETVASDPRYRFTQGTICDTESVRHIIEQEHIDAIVHFAAESHVDRSIVGPKDFVMTNVYGTFSLLEVIRACPHVHIHHVSTDEVYGSLGIEGQFNEHSPYLPNSPYAASKAASDHFVRAYAKTYGLSTTLSHCSNNYGPFQHPEKLIPLVLSHAVQNKKIPIYGKGENVRDWLHVDDHIKGIWLILQKGKIGEVYDMGGGEEMRNGDLVSLILRELARITGENYGSLITFVADRPGHDFRYAMNADKIKNDLGWAPDYDLKTGLRETIQWTVEQSLDKLLCDVTR